VKGAKQRAFFYTYRPQTQTAVRHTLEVVLCFNEQK